MSIRCCTSSSRHRTLSQLAPASPICWPPGWVQQDRQRQRAALNEQWCGPVCHGAASRHVEGVGGCRRRSPQSTEGNSTDLLRTYKNTSPRGNTPGRPAWGPNALQTSVMVNLVQHFILLIIMLNIVLTFVLLAVVTEFSAI